MLRRRRRCRIYRQRSERWMETSTVSRSRQPAVHNLLRRLHLPLAQAGQGLPSDRPAVCSHLVPETTAGRRFTYCTLVQQAQTEKTIADRNMSLLFPLLPPHILSRTCSSHKKRPTLLPEQSDRAPEVTTPPVYYSFEKRVLPITTFQYR